MTKLANPMFVTTITFSRNKLEFNNVYVMVVVVSNDVAIVTVKGNDYKTCFWNISKTEVVSRMKNAHLNEKSEQL